MIPEAELLLCCARKELDENSRARIELLLDSNLRWDDLLNFARPHGMRPLLFRHLRTWKGRIPRPFWDSLNTWYETNSFRNLSLTRELLRVLRILEQNGIEAVPYKGPVLAQIAYGDVSLREFSDLDLLVRKSDVQRSRELLINAGYQPELSHSAAEERVFLRAQCEFSFSKGNCLVELHWAIVENFFPFPLHTDLLWSRLQPMQLGGQSIRTLSAEDLMLVLSVHNAKHLWERIGWICDIAELIRLKSFNEQVLFERAKELGCHRMLSLAFMLAHNLSGSKTTVPLRDRDVLKLAEAITTDLTSDSAQRESIVRQPLFRPRYLQLWENRMDRLRYLFRVFTTPTIEDWNGLKLPAFLFPLYYAIRPFRLCFKYIKEALERKPTFQ